MTITIHGVLAGAYRGRRNIEDRALLTHAVTAEAWKSDDGKTLCGRLRVHDSICDAEADGPPTCPTCAERYARRIGR